ncbi:MAG: response regulator [Gammaproteobacteria bacterium]|nr:MAG: response regulator [Gammaproteobacteria bacterium]
METIPDLPSSFEYAACGLVTTEVNGTIRRANKTFCKWLGFSADELIEKKKIQELFTVGGRFFHHTHWAPLLQLQGSVAEIQMDVVTSERKTLPMLINVVRQKHGDKSFDQLAFFVATDRKNFERELISTREKLNEINQQLSIADRRKDEFLATLAHELRNPLAPIRNVLEIMRVKEINDPFINSSRDLIERHISQMTHLVDDLMEASRISQGKLELRKTRIDLTDLIQHAIESSSEIIVKSNHKLTVEKQETSIFIDADSTRINQIISNLLNNAAKYTPEEGTISLKVFQDRDEAIISVADSGIGIPAEQLSNIFTMFSQLTPALERSQGGLGIGLALVHSLVKLHGGSIIAYSEGEGKGSEFIVRLPISNSSEEIAATSGDSPSAHVASKRVLVIDDNIDAAESLAMLLELAGHVCRTAHDGMTGLKIAEEFHPEIILLDIGLPDINGYEVAQRIRQQAWGKNIVLIAATGWGQGKDKELAKDAGFDEHLTKPIDFQQLSLMLENISPSQF